MISGEVDLQHILVGALLSLLIVLFWREELFSRLPSTPNIKELLYLGHFILLLVGYIIQANISVARTLLFSNPPAKPVLWFGTFIRATGGGTSCNMFHYYPRHSEC